MHQTSPFKDRSETTADLALLESLRWARYEFLRRVTERSATKNDDVLSVLRIEATYQLSEFLYLIRAREIESVDQMRALAELHNEYIVELTKDQDKVNRMGLNRDRLLEAIFTADTMPRLLHQWVSQPKGLDQSNLARFLASLMSTETCRKVVLACAEAGFLKRSKSPFGTVLVSSFGTLEIIFAETLRALRLRILEN